MKTNLIKLINKNDIDVNDLSEKNITEYVQTKRTMDLINQRIINPYTSWAKESREEILLSVNKLTIEYLRNKIKVKRTDKEVVEVINGTLDSMLRNNSNNKNMFGVKRFEGVTSVDTIYLLELFNKFIEETTGTKIEEGIKYRGRNIDDIREQQKGEIMFALTNYSRIIQRLQIAKEKELTIGNSLLYIAANEELKKLSELVIKPFENKFKEQAEKSNEGTVVDIKEYGNLAVQVKTTAKEEVNYTNVKDTVEQKFNQYKTSQGIGMGLFFNEQLLEPRPYVAIGKVLGEIKKETDKKEIKHQQELNIIYNPKKAIILTE